MKVLQVLVLILCLAVFATAQRASLSGRIYDQAGAAISETKISLINKDGRSFGASANDDGFYQVDIPPGTYLLEAEYPKHQSWEKFRIEKYEIPANIRMTLDITLRLDEEFTIKHGDQIIGEPLKENKTKRKNKNNK